MLMIFMDDGKQDDVTSVTRDMRLNPEQWKVVESRNENRHDTNTMDDGNLCNI